MSSGYAPAYARRAIPAPTTPIRRPPWTKRLPAPDPVTVAAGADVVVGLTSITVVWTGVLVGYTQTVVLV